MVDRGHSGRRWRVGTSSVSACGTATFPNSSRATAKAKRQSFGLPVGFADCRRWQSKIDQRGTWRDQPGRILRMPAPRCRRFRFAELRRCVKGEGKGGRRNGAPTTPTAHTFESNRGTCVELVVIQIVGQTSISLLYFSYAAEGNC